MTQTVRAEFVSMLENNGLFQDEAESVITQAESDELTASMRGKWDHPFSELPRAARVTLWINLRCIAIKWLSENKPDHWAIPMLKD